MDGFHNDVVKTSVSVVYQTLLLIPSPQYLVTSKELLLRSVNIIAQGTNDNESLLPILEGVCSDAGAISSDVVRRLVTCVMDGHTGHPCRICHEYGNICSKSCALLWHERMGTN